MSVIAYIWRNPPRDEAQGFPDHEAMVTCGSLDFALKLKGILQHVDSAYRITILQCSNYAPLMTTRPQVTQEELAAVNTWLVSKGFPPLEG